MANKQSYGASFLDWEGLLAAVDRNAALLPGADALKATLQTLVTQGKELKLKQEGFAGSRQSTTEQLRAVFDQGRETARMLRAFVTSHLGSRTEMLAEYNIPPARSRKVKKAKPPTVPTPEAKTPQAAVGGAEPNSNVAEQAEQKGGSSAIETGAPRNSTAP